MPSQNRNIKRTFSVKYQPRRMVLPRTKRLHVLGMSMTRLNISTSYKNRIKTLLINNKALALALAQSQHENTIKERENLQLKKMSQSHSNFPTIVTEKLHLICDHMNAMIGLIQEVSGICDSQRAPSLTKFQTHLDPSSTSASCRIGGKRDNQSSLPYSREEQWVNNMTVIEEQSFTESESLPPMRFVEEDIRRPSCKAVTKSASRSSGRLSRMTSSRGSRYSSLFCESNSADDASPPDRMPSESHGACRLSGQMVVSASPIATSPKSPPPVTQNVQQEEERKESYDRDIAVRFDPALFSQALTPGSTVSAAKRISPQVLCERFDEKEKDEVTKAEENLLNKSLGNRKAVVLSSMQQNNKTFREVEDMELTEVVVAPVTTDVLSVSALGTRPKKRKPAKVVVEPDLLVSSRTKRVSRKVAELQKRVAEFTQSFSDQQSFSMEKDPNFQPTESKKRNTKAKKSKLEGSASNVSHKFFSTSPRCSNKKATSGRKAAFKVSKKVARSIDKVATKKRDATEHPSAVFDLTVGDSLTQSMIQPFRQFSKAPLREKTAASPTIEEESGSPRLHKRIAYVAREAVVCSSDAEADCHQGAACAQVAENMLSTEVEMAKQQPKKRRTSKLPRISVNKELALDSMVARLSAAEKGASPDNSKGLIEAHKRGSRRAASSTVSYREPSLHKSRRERCRKLNVCEQLECRCTNLVLRS